MLVYLRFLFIWCSTLVCNHACYWTLVCHHNWPRDFRDAHVFSAATVGGRDYRLPFWCYWFSDRSWTRSLGWPRVLPVVRTEGGYPHLQVIICQSVALSHRVKIGGGVSLSHWETVNHSRSMFFNVRPALQGFHFAFYSHPWLSVGWMQIHPAVDWHTPRELHFLH